MKGVSKDYQAKLLEKCQSVTKEDILSATRKYYMPLFDPEKSIAVVVATPAKVDHIEEGLKSVGFEVERRELGDDWDGDLVDGSGSGSGSGSDGSVSGSERE
jgi:Zn-dependent M16 (insulinase) family peptidase